MYQIQEYYPKLYLFTFNHSQKMGYSFCRFSEYSESPKFKNQVFTLKEYKEWYKTQSQTGKFTYCGDIDGFNIPDYVFDPFLAGKFNPLSKAEKQLLNSIKCISKPYYIISINKNSSDVATALRHEMAHGLYYLNADYKKEIDFIIDNFPKKFYQILQTLLSGLNYHSDHFYDEIQAYAQSTNDLFDRIYFPSNVASTVINSYKEMVFEIQQTFKKYTEKSEENQELNYA